ncbi:uncharacterized protein FOMMEDRAFT_128127 [Fomitiporia mediterranea MF3/22]|uniref:uncharacterized protein n=1 Tax=Fomitiporia mediterranea (strain MF3/22) TaxID=694068 RepID=UPI0004409494|nr:uncharacterized protein FOMMEDRAFT_128127 [Fomitiporia mediterranea MF3/22]EJC99476.1 hypothetical protein FOMMEDRAFT_128127 [Fomitiporia mediterranea MF3/22]
MGRTTFRIGHAAAVKNNRKNAVRRASCSGNFISSPSAGQQVDVSSEVMFAWDNTCLNITAADIYLYAPYQTQSILQMFQDVDFTEGSYNATLKPKWWNSTSTVQLQLTIVQTGMPVMYAELPPGPIWIAKYDASAKGTSASDIGTTSSGDGNVTKVNNLESAKSGGVSKGGIAAAVLVPLIVIGLAILAYIKISRQRGKERRKRWSEAVDQRMSVISGDWRSMSVKGAEAAVRASVIDPNRSSIWSGSGNAGVGTPRPSSTYAVEGASADGNIAQPEMAQIRRPGVGPRGPVASTAGSVGRASRVSFAADTRFSRTSTGDGLGSRARPSGESRRTGVPSRAFHSAYIPPVPSRLSEYVPDVIDTNNGSDSEDTSGGMMSPTQRSGPLDLSAEEIQARMNGGQTNESRPSFDAMMPALSMMRTNNSSQTDLLLERHSGDIPPVPPLRVNTASPTVPPPAAAAKSPVMDAMPLSAVSSVMSPDEMLRAYAERRRTGASLGGISSPPGSPAPVTGIAFPMPVVTTNTGVTVTSPPSTMRTLYSPGPVASFGAAATSVSASETSTVLNDSATNPFRKSMAQRSADSQYTDEDAYFGSSAH